MPTLLPRQVWAHVSSSMRRKVWHLAALDSSINCKRSSWLTNVSKTKVPQGPAFCLICPDSWVYPFAAHAPAERPPADTTIPRGQMPTLLSRQVSAQVPSSMRRKVSHLPANTSTPISRVPSKNQGNGARAEGP